MRPFDVVLVGEILVELYSEEPLTDDAALRLGFSGDVLNAAAAAAAAGARTAVLTSIGDDELGGAILARVADLGIDTSLIRRNGAVNGAYMLHGDLSGRPPVHLLAQGERRLADDRCRHRPAAGCSRPRRSGCAIRHLCRTVLRLRRRHAGRRVHRRRRRRRRPPRPELPPPPDHAAQARATLAQIAPYCTVVTPSCPGDSRPLLGTGDPHQAVAGSALGARAVAVTNGSEPVIVDSPDGEFTLPVPHIPDAVDATGAGDVFAGTLGARLALGDPLPRRPASASALLRCQ